MNRDNSINCAIKELTDYLSSYTLSTISSLPDFVDSLSRLYRPFHSLLIWGNYFRIKNRNHFKHIKEYSRFLDYYTEVNSDICYAILLFSQGMYKPGLLQMRSSIENFIKCVGIYENAPVLTIKSVYDLFNSVKLLPIVKSRPEYEKEVINIHQKYKSLCAYAHSKDYKYMSLTTALGKFPLYDRNACNYFVENCKSIISSYNILIILMFSEELSYIHYADRDLILDNIRKRIKTIIYACAR